MNLIRLSCFSMAGLLLSLTISCGDSSKGKDKYFDIVTITKPTTGVTDSRGAPLKDRIGPVNISHKTHKSLGMKCVQCHHKEYNEERLWKCAPCHMGEEGYKKMHGLCVDCHINRKKGPRECYDCHAKLKQ